MKRYFVAIDIPSQIKKDIISYYYPLLEEYFDGKFTEEEKLHITLLFLGNFKISEEFKEFIRDIKFLDDIRISGINGFPNIIKPRIVYGEIHNNLKTIAKDIADFLRIKFDEDFKPHVTLCRVKKIKKQFNKMAEEKEFSFIASSISLFESDFKNYYKII